MALDKRNATLSFKSGMDTKTDPFQLPFGKFTNVVNCIFTTNLLLGKRNGYQLLSSPPDSTSNTLSTFNNDLVAIGNTLQSYSSSSKTWTTTGNIIPCSLSVTPTVRSSTSQSQADSVTSSSGLTCTVFTDQDPTNVSDKVFRYAISNQATGNYVIPPTTIASADATYGTPRVFLLSGYFIIVFTVLITAVYHLRYIAVSILNPSVITSPADLAAAYTPATTQAFDGAVLNNTLYVAYNGAAAAGIKMVTLTNSLATGSTIIRDGSHTAVMISVSADTTNNLIWVSYYKTAGTTGYVLCVDSHLNSVLAATQIINSGTVLNITSYPVISSNSVNIYYEVQNAYAYDSGFYTNYINTVNVNTSGTVSSTTTVIRSVGLASKAFSVGGNVYFLAAYQSPYQSTYFLLKSNGNVVSKIAYQNGGSYLTTGLPGVTVSGTTAYISYLYRFAITPINKTTGLGIYGQYGINNATFQIDPSNISTAEIGQNLHLSGGFLWSYDGNAPVENNFHLWPDMDTSLNMNGSSLAITASSMGGSITTQDYFYIATYEWQDNQGNLVRSGTSIQVPLKSADLSGSTNTVTIKVPTLRLTYKTANPVKIVLYRWSTGQQIFYQVTSTTNPVLNTTSSDIVTITDTSADATIAGNAILYTNGGILENTGGPAFSAISLFDSRLIGILAEDQNTLSFSQPVVTGTPVEMSQFLTKYIPPTLGSDGSTGANECLAAMDDKCILFKQRAIYYFNGVGPTLAGANSQYSEPYFISSVVGCNNQASIVFVPQGLMFQAQDGLGIWILGRDLSVKYIGAEVEVFNGATVLSALTVPGTTYVLFNLSTGITLMYDYYFNQWGTFQGIYPVSSVIVNSLHTFIDSRGRVFQETPDQYLDGASPVLMSLQSGWISLAGIQGYQRAYWMYLMGTYSSPHKIYAQIGFDYNPSPTQAFVMTPTNTATSYGSASPYGTGVYGATTPLEQYRICFKTQKCQSFQFSFQEIYDPSQGIAAGAGLTFSSGNIVFGYKKGYPRVAAAQSVG